MTLTIVLLSAAAWGQNPCKSYFSIVWRDYLKNMDQGFSAGDLKWFQAKMAKKYPDVCYMPPDPSDPDTFATVILFVDSVQTTCRTKGAGLTWADPRSPIRTCTRFRLVVEERDGHKDVTAMRVFAGAGGSRKVIEDAIKWIHNGGLANALPVSAPAFIPAPKP